MQPIADMILEDLCHVARRFSILKTAYTASLNFHVDTYSKPTNEPCFFTGVTGQQVIKIRLIGPMCLEAGYLDGSNSQIPYLEIHPKFDKSRISIYLLSETLQSKILEVLNKAYVEPLQEAFRKWEEDTLHKEEKRRLAIIEEEKRKRALYSAMSDKLMEELESVNQ